MEIIKSEKAPEAIGPYSQAVVHNGIVYCSGQIALDPATMNIVDGGIEKQTIQVMENLKAVLEKAGSSMENVMKATVYLVNLEDFGIVNGIYGNYFTGKPARVTVQVSKLPKNSMIEIECTAIKI